MNIYYIGGSPCSGKSTVAEILAAKYNLYYFKVDDFLDNYTQMGAAQGYDICKKQTCMSAEEIWMREPALQCREEITFYKEIFAFIWEDLEKLNADGVITEGAEYLPELMKSFHIPKDRYVSITPSKEFQVAHYSQREWVPYVLADCSDQKKAFSNWMDRDAMFALEVQGQCAEAHYCSIINDGTIELAQLVNRVEDVFQLKAFLEFSEMT